MPDRRNTYAQIVSEVQQAHPLRKPLYEEMEKILAEKLGKPAKVVAFFTSFIWPVVIDDTDADMIEEVLQNADLDGKELVMMINSPGGEALAAERIVNICRSYTSGAFSVIVPKMAKSAATMICFGANTIRMAKTSELGPVDPQIPIRDDRNRVVDYKPAHEIIESYNELMTKANQTKGRLEPYLQQLALFDARDIQSIVSAQALSESISIKCLKTGVLANLSERRIKAKMKAFFDPAQTKVHGRPIYPDVAQRCGLPVQIETAKSPLWRAVWNLYVRLNYVVNTKASKVVEGAADFEQYVVPVPSRQGA